MRMLMTFLQKPPKLQHFSAISTSFPEKYNKNFYLKKFLVHPLFPSCEHIHAATHPHIYFHNFSYMILLFLSFNFSCRWRCDKKNWRGKKKKLFCVSSIFGSRWASSNEETNNQIDIFQLFFLCVYTAHIRDWIQHFFIGR